ncbi:MULTISPECIES: hypothetical protein [Polynucleobacter]|uniref:Uncharacterized protein n=1 Tax=uncultured Caudovirales phage TaxID=2100421 RepID=A0A6J5KJR8_9CAUD|nr:MULTISPECIES: hypothetical protein [Polynucleobacter]QWD55190.1 hypothetical protein C2750_05495 [Polynucleobacter paneuropaeus]QWE17315.1 hypothetical protein FD960_03620 [Polynucleobacter sp. AP-Nino-20-G2]CAB4121376.1 hypothetical protein UFOVP13_50 [uncultured Caudovirales phage]
MSKFLSKQDILAANDLKRVEVDVPEWGGKVWVTSFSADAKDAIEFNLMNLSKKSGVGLRAAYVGLAIVDEHGQRLFTDEELPMLGTKFAGAIDRIFEKVSEINRISQKDLEELEKNSEAVPGDGLHSASA